MNVTAKQDAGRRTKNRVREHGPKFELVKGPTFVDCLQDMGLLLRSEDGWTGWLPVDEILLDNVDGK